MNDKILIINKKDLKPKKKNQHEKYQYTKYEVTNRKDYNQAYVAIYEIPPLKSNYPYHYHEVNTEVFYILEGKGILKTPDGEKEIKTGDFVVCPPSEKGAHKITNTSKTEILKYIDIDTTNSPDIVHYPDSKKTGIIIHNKSSSFFKNNDKVDYYEDE